MGSIPIGQSVSATPRQVLSAYNAIAHRGTYVAPRLVARTRLALRKTDAPTLVVAGGVAANEAIRGTLAELATATVPGPIGGRLWDRVSVLQPHDLGAHLTRFENAVVPTGRLLGMQRRGWARGEPQDAGVERWFSREVGPNCFVVLDLDPGIAVGYVEEFPEQTLRTVWVNTRPDDHWPSRTTSLRFGDLDPVTASEVLADLTELTTR